MISLYTGSVGSGKSYHGTALGIEWINRGKHVIANYPLKFRDTKRGRSQSKRWIFKDDITVEWLMAMSIEHGWFGKESQCLLQIDEAGIIFNSRDWQTQADQRKRWIKFLSQSRKFGYDIVFICQADRMIDKQIRGLVEYEVKHLKANNSFFMSFLSLFKVTLFLYVYRWYQTKLKSNLRMEFYKPWIANRYDTMRTFNLDELINYLEGLYEGKIIPANVAMFISLQRDELEARIAAKAMEEQLADTMGGVTREGPSGEGTESSRHRFRTLLTKITRKTKSKRNKEDWDNEWNWRKGGSADYVPDTENTKDDMENELS